MELPDGWAWSTQWGVDSNRACDEEGNNKWVWLGNGRSQSIVHSNNCGLIITIFIFGVVCVLSL